MDAVCSEISVEDFMAKFLPGRNMTSAQLQKAGDLRGIEGMGYFAETMGAICRVFNNVLRVAKSPDTFVETDTFARQASTSTNPEIIWQHHLPRGRKTTAHLPWAWTVMAVEVKHSEAEGAFYFSSTSSLLRETAEGSEAYATLEKYAQRIRLWQHRTHGFTLCLAGRCARLLRWDQAGCVVSAPIDLEQHPETLLNCIYRLARGGREVQGYDPTACLATKSETARIRSYQTENKWLRQYTDLMLDNEADYPIYKIHCNTFPWAQDPFSRPNTRSAQTSRAKAFLVGRPVDLSSESQTSRSTKGFVAFDLETRRFCFVKDFWRHDSPYLKPEWETYRRLREHGVTEHVGSVIAGGDVGGPSRTQRTILLRTNERYVHSRLVMREVGRPLETYGTSVELIIATYHALLGHRDAWEKAKVLHRDVSIGNIMIDVESSEEDPRGMLIDWDVCRYEDEPSTSEQLGGQTGTWPFISALALKYPKKPMDLADDLESFLYVILYMALRFHRHTFSPQCAKTVSHDELLYHNGLNSALAVTAYRLFCEEYDVGNGYRRGGQHKFAYTRTIGNPPMLPIELLDSNSHLARLIEGFYAILRRHYRSVDLEELEKYVVERKKAVRDEHVGTPEESKKPEVNRGQWHPPAMPGPKSLAALLDHSSSESEGDTMPRPRPSPVLHQHEPVVQAFHRLFCDKDGNWKGMPKIEPDKFVDQFLGLRGQLGVCPKRGSTRVRDPDDDAQSEHPSKKRRLTLS